MIPPPDLKPMTTKQHSSPPALNPLEAKESDDSGSSNKQEMKKGMAQHCDDNCESRSKPLPDGQPKKYKTTSLASAPVREKDDEAVVPIILEEGLEGMQYFHGYVIFGYLIGYEKYISPYFLLVYCHAKILK